MLGGAGLVLFATVAASGIRALGRVSYEGNNNLVIVALSIGMGVIPIAVPTFYEHFPSWFQTVFDSGISSAAVTAVLLNLLFNVGRSDTTRRRHSSPSRRPSASRPTTTCRAAPRTRATPPTTVASDAVAAHRSRLVDPGPRRRSTDYPPVRQAARRHAVKRVPRLLHVPAGVAADTRTRDRRRLRVSGH